MPAFEPKSRRRLWAEFMDLNIEFLSSLAGTDEYGLPIVGGRIFDNDFGHHFLVRARTTAVDRVRQHFIKQFRQINGSKPSKSAFPF